VIPEFLPEDERAARARRVAVTVAIWVTGGIWLLCYLVPIALLIPSSIADLDAEYAGADTTLASIGVGTVFLAAYCLLVVCSSMFTTRTAHVRALRTSRPDTEFIPNTLTGGVSRLARTTAPRARVRAGGTRDWYVGLSDTELTVWGAGDGLLTCLVAIPRSTITHVERGLVDMQFGWMQGVLVTTTAVVHPLELAPREHVFDHRASAQRLARHLELGDRSRATSGNGSAVQN
jgi:hypothetical protein